MMKIKDLPKIGCLQLGRMWLCQGLLELGFMPFCQLYQPDDGVKVYPEEWRKLRRKWSRPAAYMSPIRKQESRETGLSSRGCEQ